MRNQLLLKQPYNRGIYKFLFVVSFIFSFSSAIGQEVTINKTAVANPTECKQFDIELSIMGNPIDKPQEVVLIIDRSGSMDDAPGSQNDPIDYAQDAAIDFVNEFFLPANNPTGKNKIALVTFNYSATVNVSLSGSSSQATIINSINAITTSGSTNTADALLKADNELTTNGTFDCATSRSIILLSDGVANNGPAAIQAGVNAQTTTVQGVEYDQSIFTIGLVGAISGNDQTSALNTLDGIQNSGAYWTENNADLTTIYGSILGQLVSVAKQLPGQALVSDAIQAGFSVVPGTFVASKGNAVNVGQMISWYVNSVTNETITLKYTIVANDDSVCGTLLPGTSVINYEDSMCDIQSVEFNNPTVCVPCPEITPVISMSGCSNSIAYSSILTQNECPSTNDTYAWEFFLNGTSIGTSNTESGVFDYTGNGLFQGDFIARLTYSGTYVSGCTLPDVEEQASIVIQNILDINIISQTNPECANENTGEIVVEGVNGNPPYEYSIDNGSTYQNSGTFSNLEDGVYTLQVRDSAGCSVSSIDVTLLDGDGENPTWTIPPSDLTVECDGTADPNGAFANWLTSFSGTDNSGNATVTHNSTGLSDLCGATGTETVTFILSDDCGNSISADAIFTIADTTVPTFNEALPTDLTVECDNIPSIGTLTANDSCGTAIVTFNEVRIDTSCDSEYTLERTWTATDECGLVVAHTQTIIVEDNSVPTFNETLPSDDTVECDNVPAAATLTASDNCDANVNVVFTETITGDTDACPSEYTITRTWSITDCAGNTDSHIQTITVEDNTAPTFNETPLGDVTEECDAVTPALTLTATDNCDSNVVVNFNEQRTDGSCPSNYTLVRTWTVSDCAGNTTAHTQNVTVQDTTAPVLSTVASDQTVQCDGSGNSNQLQAWLDTNAGAIATDNCGTVSWSNNFTGLTDNCGETGVALVTFTATDECGNATISTALFTILDLLPPTMDTEAGDMTLECDAANNDAALQAWISSNGGALASDICSNVTWTNDFTALTDDCGATGSATVTFTATDDCGNAISTSASFTIQDTTDPIFNETLPADITEECDVVTSPITLTATDNCGNAIVTFEELRTDGSCVSDYTLTRTWTATDDCGNTAIHTQTVTVQDNTAPNMDVEAADIAIECDGSGNNGAIDAWLNNNGGASASDSCGTVTWTNNYGGQTSDCATPINVTFTATDECGNQTTTTASYAIQDTNAPTIDVEASNLTEECDGSGNAAALQAWLDNNGGASASDDCSAIAWDNDFNGLSDDCGATGSATVTFTVTDGCGNSSSTTATFSIEDNTVPTFNETLPGDVTEECDVITNPATLTASDSCGDATVTFDEVRTDGTCASDYTLTRTWTATDACGNTSVHTQTVIVQDNTAPTFNEILPSDVTEECDVVTPAATLTATDNCGTANVTFDEVRTDGSCPASYTLIRTWTATDDCGNVTVHTQTVTVQDNTAPTFNETLPSNVTEEYDAITPAITLTATDNCGEAVVTFNETRLDGACASDYSLSRTWTASDACGNTTIHTQTVTIQNNVPTFNVEATNMVLACDGSGNIEAMNDWLNSHGGAIVSNTGGNITWTHNYGGQAADCSAPTVVTFTATDDCGNVAVTAASYSIQDINAPIIEVEANDLTEECDGSGNTAALQNWLDNNGGASASDDCSAITWSNDFNGLSDDCGATGNATVTFTVTDGCGNSSSTAATFTIEDNIAPTFNETLPSDVTEECDNLTGTTVTLTASDSCGDATVTFDEVRTDGDCPSNYILTRTWTATDACGNTTAHTQTVTIQDTTAPTFNEPLPADITEECDSLTGTTVTLTATDNCGDATVTFDEVRTDGDCPSSYILTRTWTASDACGNTTVHTQTVTIQDTTAPIFNEPLPDDTTEECDSLTGTTVTLTATDNCGDATVTFNEVRTDGDCPSSYVLTRTWTASDSCGNTTSHAQTVTIQDTTAPVLENLPTDNGNETCDEPFKNGDFEDNSVSTYAYLNEDFIVGWNTTAENGVIEIQKSGAVNNTDSYSGSFHAELNGDSASDIYQEFCTIPNAELEINFAHHKRMSGNNTTDDIVGVYVGTTPNNVQLLQTFTATSTSGWTEHTINYVVPNGQNTTVILFKAEQGAPDNNTYGNLIDGAQVFDTSNVVIECDNIPEAENVTAIDNCDADVDVILTETTIEGSCPGSYQLVRTWTATDDCGNSSQFVQTLTIQDLTAPTFVEDLPQNENYECSDVPEAITLTAIDNCTNATVTLTETRADGNCPGAFVITRIWVASDECNNQITHTQVINVQDTTAPEFNEELPVDVIVECDDIPEVPTLTATDNCGDAMLEFNEETVDGDCPSNYTITRTWTATDDCDNTVVHTQTITVQDTTAPVVTTDFEDEISVSCGDIPDAPQLEFEDACSSDISVSYEETSTQDANGNDYEIIREWTVSDACDNTAIYTQTVFVNTDSNVGGTDTELCNGDDVRFDLFNLLTGDYGTEGTWIVSPNNATIEDGHYFNPLGLDIGLYIFTYTDDVSVCPSETMVEIELNDDCIVLPCGDADEVIISKAVTGNGDNINDYFTIEGIEGCGFTVEVQIYNRWGAKIYESKNYQNNWNGTSHGNSIGGSDKVPTGTYYYIINLVDSGLKPFAGPIYVGTK